MQQMKRLVVLAAVLALSACASTQRLSEAERAQLKYVAVSKTVDKGQFVLANGGGKVGDLFGSATSPENAFETFVEAKGVSIGTIVRDEFEKALRDSNKVTVVQPGKTTAPVISIAIPKYGFGAPLPLHPDVMAIMQIQCALTDSTGKVLWTGTAQIYPSVGNGPEGTTWKQLHDSPWVVEDQWRKAARYLAQKAVATL